MKRALSVLLLTTFMTGAAAATTLHFGTATANPPFVTVNAKNQPAGFDIDLAKALCKQMQVECTFTPQNFATLIPALRFKKFDAIIAGIEVLPMRERQVAFSQPYRQRQAGAVIVEKDTAHGFADLAGKRIGVVKDSAHQHYLRDKQKEVNVIPYANIDDAFNALREGSVDGVMGEQSAMTSWRQDNPEYIIIDELATDPQYYSAKRYAIAVRKDDPELHNAINTALEAVKASPDFKQMEQKWFK